MKTELLEGPCKVRGVSLPVVMDKALTQQAQRNYRSISKEIQLALARYLGNGDRKRLEVQNGSRS